VCVFIRNGAATYCKETVTVLMALSVKTLPALLRCFLSESVLTVERVYHYVFHREAKSSTPFGTFSR
jgi:hypothetical protein